MGDLPYHTGVGQILPILDPMGESRLNALLVLGVILIVGVLGGHVAHRFGLPSVTGYLLIGIIMGPSVTGLISKADLTALQPVNDFALGLIGLSIGGELRWHFLRRKWRSFGLLFLGEGLTTILCVFVLTYMVSRNLPLALILGVLALATAPGSILDVINENRTRGSFPRVVMSLVALDNLFCIVAFTAVTTVLNLYYFNVDQGRSLFESLSRELGLALLLAVVLGALGLTVVNRVNLLRQRQVLIMAVMFLAVGLPRHLEVSYLLVTLVTGLIIVNLSRNFRKFYEILHTIDTPLLVVFLTLAGMKLQLAVLPGLGLLGLVYISARFLGKVGGSRLGAELCALIPGRHSAIAPEQRKSVGLALTPQAGVAIGLSLLAEQTLPLPENLLVSLILGSVIFFEIVGPMLVLRALDRTGSLVKHGG